MTIGQPVPGVRAWVLDPATLAQVADGVPGELCLGGAGLARGYWKQPELTASKFVEHPKLGRLYRTGDLATRDAHRGFEYQGRIDSQVKIRGHRVELGEIESRLSEVTRRARGGLPAPERRDPGRFWRRSSFRPIRWRCRRIDEVTRHARAHAARRTWSRRASAGSTHLPTNLAGKLDRARLPVLPDLAHATPAPLTAHADEIEALVGNAVRDVLGLAGAVEPTAHFFTALGGDSLSAARLVTALRDDPRTPSLAVRDVYDAPTVSGLAAVARTAAAHGRDRYVRDPRSAPTRASRRRSSSRRGCLREPASPPPRSTSW